MRRLRERRGRHWGIIGMFYRGCEAWDGWDDIEIDVARC